VKWGGDGPVADERRIHLIWQWASPACRLRVCAKFTSDFGGNAPGQMRGPREGVYPLRYSTEVQCRWPGAAPPRRAGGLWLAGPAAARLLLDDLLSESGVADHDPALFVGHLGDLGAAVDVRPEVGAPAAELVSNLLSVAEMLLEKLAHGAGGGGEERPGVFGQAAERFELVAEFVGAQVDGVKWTPEFGPEVKLDFAVDRWV